tara:strand:- start:166 stop:579 length:414 start_codon:yes stop_codon:yes gene_type:complete
MHDQLRLQILDETQQSLQNINNMALETNSENIHVLRNGPFKVYDDYDEIENSESTDYVTITVGTLFQTPIIKIDEILTHQSDIYAAVLVYQSRTVFFKPGNITPIITPLNVYDSDVREYVWEQARPAAQQSQATHTP